MRCRMKKQPTVGRALMPLIIIPIMAFIDIILIVAGVAIDNAMYNPPPDRPGFPFPAITFIFMFIGAVITIITYDKIICCVASMNTSIFPNNNKITVQFNKRFCTVKKKDTYEKYFVGSKTGIIRRMV